MVSTKLSLGRCLPLLSGLWIACGESPPEYHRDIKPIVDAYCVSCHSEGNIAPFALDTYASLRDFAPAVRHSVVQRQMPPWHAEPGHRSYRYDPSLSDAHVDLIDQWFAAGLREGDPSDVGAPIAVEHSVLERMDIDMQVELEYEPGAGFDDYRCFPMEWPLDRVTHISGFEGVPGNLASVHHLLVFVVPPQSAARIDEFNASTQDGKPGYPCFGGVTKDGWQPAGPQDTVLFAFGGQWAPGQGPQPYPEGTGLPIEPGSRIVLQVHYSTLGEGPFGDRSGVRFSVRDEVESVGASVAWMDLKWVTKPETMRIPSGAGETWHEYTSTLGGHTLTSILAPDLDPTQPVKLHALLPHMHLLGKEINVEVLREERTDVVVRIPEYDFNWQRAYELEDAAVIYPDDRIRIQCRFDNSEAHRSRVGLPSASPPEVMWGEGTVDEMCIAMLYLSQPKL